jgi:hypothetical protein
VPNRIQVSQATAELLKEAGKGSWITPRTDAVHAKGKGVLNTYWLVPPASGAESVSPPVVAPPSNAFVKQTRLIKWMVDLFLDHINKIYASRNYKLPRTPVMYNPKQNSITLDEIVEVICLPKFDAKAGQGSQGQTKISLGAIDQLCDYVSNIASLYCKNPFHNCE